MHVLLLPLLLCVDAPLAGDFREIARSVAPSVATVEASTAKGAVLGSGFVVGDGTVLVTNFHVVQGTSTIEVAFGEDPPIAVLGIIATDPKGDLALLRLPEAHPALPLTDVAEEVGAPVLAVGNPRGLGTSFSDGMLSSEHLRGGYHVIQHSAPISPGNSGGPLLDESGAVLGVNSFQLANDYGQNVNFAVGVRHVQALLDKARETLASGRVVSAAEGGDLAIRFDSRRQREQVECNSPTDPAWPFETAQKLWEMAEVHKTRDAVCRHGRAGDVDQVFARHHAPSASDTQADAALAEQGWTAEGRDGCEARFTRDSAELVLTRHREHLLFWVQQPEAIATPHSLCGSLTTAVSAAQK